MRGAVRRPARRGDRPRPDAARGQGRSSASSSTQPGGPRLLLYTGGRLPEGQTLTAREAGRYAELLQPGAPAYAAPSAADTADGTSTVFSGAFAGAPSPFGGGFAPAGVTPLTGGAPAAAGARTHYAFDSDGSGGPVRVIVIDNSRGSLAASDPHQNPPEPQLPWLRAMLADARARGIPAIVVGSRDLNSRFQPSLNVATDADEVAQVLVDGGASAYFFERPEENRVYPIPSGGEHDHSRLRDGHARLPLAAREPSSGPDAVFGDAGLLLAEVDTAKRDPATNRAPVVARLLPVVSELTLQAVDGTFLRRSRPSLFQGLGRRPAGGDRWGPAVGGGDPQPPGSDPYTAFPAQPCAGPACSTRITPEYEFSSSAPDIGDFVAQDPASTNLRKPLIGADDKVVTDRRSGLFCPFNAGKTTITVQGRRARVLDRDHRPGRVRAAPVRHAPARPRRASAPPAAAPAPATPPGARAGARPAPAPIAAAAAAAAATSPSRASASARARPRRRASRGPQPPLDEPVPAQRRRPPALRPRPRRRPRARSRGRSRPAARSIRVFEEKREEEAAPEQSSAAVAYRVADHAPVAVYLYGLVVLAAFAGATLRLGLRRRERGIAAASIHVPSTLPYRSRRP